MNITFLIGNGFDLNMGLKTRYTDFYRYYMEHNPNDIISKSISNDYELWADLEIGLGAFLEKIDETQIEEFLDSKRNLEKMLSEYLTLQNQRVSLPNESAIAEEFKKKTTGFFDDFNASNKDDYKKAIANIRETINYSFITFNYTDVLDKIILAAQQKCKPFGNHASGGTGHNDAVQSAHHVHGKLTEDLILGLDNKDQIMNEKLKNNPRLTNYIIKSTVNKALGERKTEIAKDIIDKSRYICLFGLSIGDTDALWWTYIIQWLNKSAENRLVLFVNENTMVQLSGQEKIRFRDAKRSNMLDRSKCTDTKIMETVQDRIIVVPNSKIFTFENIAVENEVDRH